MVYPRTTAEFYKFTVDIIYAFIIGQSFLQLKDVLIPYENIPQNALNLFGIGIIYLIVITGWIGYHKSITVKRETGNWGTVRFVFDLFIVFIVYNLLLVANPNSTEFYSSIFIYLIPILYTLYVIWDFAKLQEIRQEEKDYKVAEKRYYITLAFAIFSLSIGEFYVYTTNTFSWSLISNKTNLDWIFMLVYIFHTLSYRLFKRQKETDV